MTRASVRDSEKTQLLALGGLCLRLAADHKIHDSPFDACDTEMTMRGPGTQHYEFPAAVAVVLQGQRPAVSDPPSGQYRLKDGLRRRCRFDWCGKFENVQLGNLPVTLDELPS